MHGGQPIAAVATRKRTRKEISKTLADGQKSVKTSEFLFCFHSRDLKPLQISLIPVFFFFFFFFSYMVGVGLFT